MNISRAWPRRLAKPSGTFAYILLEGRTPLETLYKAYQRGKEQIEETISHLEGHMLAPIGQGTRTTRSQRKYHFQQASDALAHRWNRANASANANHVPANAMPTTIRCRGSAFRDRRTPGFRAIGKCSRIPRHYAHDSWMSEPRQRHRLHRHPSWRDGRLGSRLNFEFEENKLIPAAFRQTWTGSCFLRLLEDDVVFDKYPLRLEISERGNDGSSLSWSQQDRPANRTDWQRAAKSVTLGNPSTAYIILRLVTTPIKAGTVLNFTIRIGSPQLELGALPSTPIPTDGIDARSAEHCLTDRFRSGGKFALSQARSGWPGASWSLPPTALPRPEGNWRRSPLTPRSAWAGWSRRSR